MSEMHVLGLSPDLRLDGFAARLAGFDDTVESMESLAGLGAGLASAQDQSSPDRGTRLHAINTVERTR